MELICPSCEARYQVPDGSIGEKGRQVSCMSCGHGWHAFPPLMLGAAQQAPQTTQSWGGPASEPMGEAGAPRIHGRSDPGMAAAPAGAVEAGGAPVPDNNSRSEQLAEIREMLAEVQSEATDQPPRQANPYQAATPPEAEAPPRVSSRLREETRALFDEPSAQPAPVTEEVHLDPVAEDRAEGTEPIDPLRRRMEMTGEKPVPAKPTDVRRLRRRHERRERRRVNNKQAGSGAFLTGFLLIVIIAAGMAAIYILHPQIIERMPGTETAMLEYVDFIDGFRVSVAETYDSVVGWVEKKTEKSG